MYQVSVTTTTPLLMDMSTGALTTAMIATSSLWLAEALGQNDVILLPPLILMDIFRGVVASTTVPQQQLQSPASTKAYANYSMHPPKVSFLFQN